MESKNWIAPARLQYRHLVMTASLFAVLSVWLAPMFELADGWAAWIQAVGSVVALIFAVGIPAVDRQRERAAERERFIDDSKSRFKTLYVQIGLAQSVFNLAVARLGVEPWSDRQLHIESIDSLIRRIERADGGDNHPTRAHMRQSLIVCLLDLRAMLRIDPIPHDASREAMYQVRQNGLKELQARLENMPDIGLHDRMSTIHG